MAENGFVKALGGIGFNTVHLTAFGVITTQLSSLIGAGASNLLFGVIIGLVGLAFLAMAKASLIGVGLGLTGFAALLYAANLLLNVSFIDPSLVAVLALLVLLVKYIPRSTPVVGKYLLK